METTEPANVELVRRLYEAFEARDLDRMMHAGRARPGVLPPGDGVPGQADGAISGPRRAAPLLRGRRARVGAARDHPSRVPRPRGPCARLRPRLRPRRGRLHLRFAGGLAVADQGRADQLGAGVHEPRRGAPGGWTSLRIPPVARELEHIVLEAVPNVSEGRDESCIAAFGRALGAHGAACWTSTPTRTTTAGSSRWSAGPQEIADSIVARGEVGDRARRHACSRRCPSVHRRARRGADRLSARAGSRARAGRGARGRQPPRR